jgi:tetratricopeptide (TPR) repeat protein
VNPAVICCSLIAANLVLFAQSKAPAAPTRPSVGTTAPTNTTNPSSTTNRNPNTPITSSPRPIYLSGKVVLQDGTPPPDLVKIERICNGSPRTQGYTDSKGRFQFQVDSQMNVDQDASDPFSRSSATGAPSTSPAARGALAGCDLRAVLAGFISGSISLTNHSEFDNPEVGTIVLRRAGNVEGTTISMSSLNAPKDALKAYEKGREFLKKEKSEEAERSFQKAVDLYPNYAVAWYQLGLLQTRDEKEKAEASFTKSIDADPKFVSPYLSLTIMYERSQRWQKAVELSDAVIKLNSTDFPQAYFFKAVAQLNTKDDVGAEKTARKAIELDTRHEYPQSEKLLGTVLALHKDAPGASEHFRKYLELAPNASDASQVRAQLANVEKQAVATKEP